MSSFPSSFSLLLSASLLCPACSTVAMLSRPLPLAMDHPSKGVFGRHWNSSLTYEAPNLYSGFWSGVPDQFLQDCPFLGTYKGELIPLAPSFEAPKDPIIIYLLQLGHLLAAFIDKHLSVSEFDLGIPDLQASGATVSSCRRGNW